MRRLLPFLVALLATQADAQVANRLYRMKVSELPLVGGDVRRDQVFIVTDAIDESDCSIGGETSTPFEHPCFWNGTELEWQPLGGSSGAGSPYMTVPLTPALCHFGGVPALTWNDGSSGAPTAACIVGSNTIQAYVDFDQTSDECLQGSFRLPDDYAGPIDMHYTWLTTATSGSVAWCTQITCVADAETGDPSFPAQASGNCVSDAAKGTTVQFNTASDTAVTSTGCVAGEIIYFKLCRDPDETGGQTDNLAADARLRDLNMVLWR
jgi:hypothetical protein